MSHVVKPGAGHSSETLTRERCYVRERLNDPQVSELSVADCRVLPGVTTELHRLSVDEWYVIVDGEGLVEIDREEPVAVGPGDTVVIPRGSPQRIANTGADDLKILCLCVPRFSPDCYEALE